ncbi:DUF1642 domain-containing protein [Streptococcus sp. V940]
MKIEELIEKYERLNHDCFRMVDTSGVLRDLKQLDELKTGHTDEAPRYVKNILARLRELPLHDREVWLKVIISEFKQDFSRAKWREGYEQGKVEGMVERDKVAIPQFIADWIEECKAKRKSLLGALLYTPEGVNSWVGKPENQETFALAWIFDYTVVEDEKKYKITLLNRNDGDLYLINQNAGVSDKYGHFSPVVLLFTKETNFSEQCYKLTKKEVASNGFGWVFDSPGFQIEEVEE